MENDTNEERSATLHLLPVDREALDAMTTEPVESEVSSAVDLEALEQERLLRMEDEVTAANRIFREHTVHVAGALVQSALFGTSPRIRLEAQKIILDRVLGRVQDQEVVKEKDPFKELLAACVRQVEETGENKDA